MAEDITPGAPRLQVDEMIEQKVDKQIRFMVRREIKKLPEVLHENEQIENILQGRYEGKQGLVAITDQRVIFLEQGAFRHRLEDFPYERISSVQSETAMMFGKLTIFASGNKAVVDQVAPKQQASVAADYIRSRLGKASAAPAPAAPTSPPSDDPMEKLRKLGDLKEAGILTEEEFNTQKAKILDSM
ncbi:MAG: PH domain-containing protein [Actinomycetota bacterium]|nr:PH domain-containing protein [Actinomycetota bacterium]